MGVKNIPLWAPNPQLNPLEPLYDELDHRLRASSNRPKTSLIYLCSTSRQLMESPREVADVIATKGRPIL